MWDTGAGNWAWASNIGFIMVHGLNELGLRVSKKPGQSKYIINSLGPGRCHLAVNQKYNFQNQL